jgi:hypothetical protein
MNVREAGRPPPPSCPQQELFLTRVKEWVVRAGVGMDRRHHVSLSPVLIPHLTGLRPLVSAAKAREDNSKDSWTVTGPVRLL